MVKKTYQVQGMHCTSCATAIELDLEDAGVVAKCNFAKQTLEVEANRKLDEEKIRKTVEKSGYKII